MDVRDALLGDREPHCPGRRDELDVRAPLRQVLGGADSLPEPTPVVDDEGALRDLAARPPSRSQAVTTRAPPETANAGGPGTAPVAQTKRSGFAVTTSAGVAAAPSLTSTPRRSSSRSR